MKEMSSPNFDSRGGQEIDMLVLHYTGMKTSEDALKKLCNPDAKVSAHYFVREDGEIHRLVPESARAWHAGLSHWRGHTNINQRSIGIEIVNPGHEYGYRPFPAVQMKAVAALCRDILAEHKTIPPRNVVGHSDIAPTRKQDPGELFDWPTLAKLGIGLFPGQEARKGQGDTNSNHSCHLPQAACLADYGYDTTDLPKAITAFQRHFRPNNISGQWDSECASLLASLLSMV